MTFPFEFNIPDPEVLIQRAQEARQTALDRLAENPSLFWAPSIGVWLEIAREARVPFVEATEVYRIPRETLLNFEQMPPEDEVYFEGLAKVVRDRPHGQMLRWDGCAPISLKSAMASAISDDDLHKSMGMLTPDDPRAFEIIHSQPTEMVGVWQRPWVKARSHGSHPVEYRVFVEGGSVTGVANYYIQRGLPKDDQVLIEVEVAKSHARELIAAAKRIGRLPWMPDQGPEWAEHEVNATLDFLVDDEGRVVFLEAGPAFGLGAHPCAFMNLHPGYSGPISTHGLALGGQD